MNLNEKVSIEEIGEDYDEFEIDWAKYVANLCKNCGCEQDEPHCENKD